MRIGFIGASGTGKSRLTQLMADEFSLPICPVGSRSVAKDMGFESPYDTDAAGKRNEFQARLFETKRAWEREHDAFVSDRTHIDNLAYASMHGCAEKFSNVDLLEYRVAMDRYTHIFYLPLEKFQHLGDDPQRQLAEGYHQVFDTLVDAFMQRMLVPHFIVVCKPHMRLDKMRPALLGHLSRSKAFPRQYIEE